MSETTAARWSRLWAFPVAPERGWTAGEMVDEASEGKVDLFWIVGGNFLETLPDVERSRRALRRPRLRVHHDIVLSTSMLAESDGDVVILPAATRYESEGGGTETSTERRIIFSPEIPGRRVGRARPEWWAFGEAMARAWPARANYIRFHNAAAIRSEMAEAIPLYKGIETLTAKGDQVQWGGRTLYADGLFATPNGKAWFTPVRLDARVRLKADTTTATPAGRSFLLSTRRGKQFNSMVQRDVDPLTGAARDDIFISKENLSRLSLSAGRRARLRSAGGVFEGTLRQAAVKPGNLVLHWPEGNVLLSGWSFDPDSMEPDYNAVVTLERI